MSATNRCSQYYPCPQRVFNLVKKTVVRVEQKDVLETDFSDIFNTLDPHIKFESFI